MTTLANRVRRNPLYSRYLQAYTPTWKQLLTDIWPPRTSLGFDSTRPLLWMLLLVDLGFVIAHLVLFYTDLLQNELFSLRKDQAYPEFFMYLEEFWIGFLLVWHARRTAEPRYLVWAALFGYMLADDYLMLHEKVGAAVAGSLGVGEQMGLRGQDVGELGFFMLVGGAFVVLLFIAYRSGGPDFRRISAALFGLLALFAFFAVVADLLHIVLPIESLNHVFDVIEDGGEMAMMSWIVWFVYTRLIVGRAPADADANERLLA